MNLHHGLGTAFRYQTVYYESSKPFYNTDDEDAAADSSTRASIDTDLDSESAFRDFPGPPNLHMSLWAASHRLDPNNTIPTLRHWAYALWNPTRSSQIFKHLTQKSFSPITTTTTTPSQTPSPKTAEESESSYERRRLIHLAGGRGWWSENDESRIVWTKKQTPLDSPEKRAQCPYCIGNVFCTPHRLVLVLPSDSGVRVVR